MNDLSEEEKVALALEVHMFFSFDDDVKEILTGMLVRYFRFGLEAFV